MHELRHLSRLLSCQDRAVGWATVFLRPALRYEPRSAGSQILDMTWIRPEYETLRNSSGY